MDSAPSIDCNCCSFSFSGAQFFSLCPVRHSFKQASLLMLNMSLCWATAFFESLCPLYPQSASSLSVNGKMFQAHLAFSCPKAWRQLPSKEPWFLFWRLV